MRKFLSILAFCLGVTACIYPYTPDLDEAPEGVLAVDANISIGEMSTVRLGTLYSIYPSENYSYPDLLTGTKVWLEDDAGGTYPGTTGSTAFNPQYSSYMDYYGTYVDASNPLFYISTENAPGDRRYRLCIEALGATYASDWTTLAEPPVIQGIEFLADDENVTVGVSLDGGPDATGYVLLSFEETWKFHVDYIPEFTLTPYTNWRGEWALQVERTGPDASKYWCWRSQNNNRTYPVDYTAMTTGGVTNWPIQQFPRTDTRNHLRYSVNVKAQTISKETYRFLKNLEDNSDGGDNLFTPTPGEIAGNLRCESDPDRTVLGYARFAKTVSKRAWLDNRYLKSRPSYYALIFTKPEQYQMYYKSGYTVLEEHDPPQEGDDGPYGWGPPQCYDCTSTGGTLTRPDFWED